MPVPQRVDFLVERAPEPVHKKLIDNGATSQFEPTLAMRRGINSPAGLLVIASADTISEPKEYDRLIP